MLRDVGSFMKLTLAIVWAITLVLTYEYAFKFGVQSEMMQTFKESEKVRNCLAVIAR